MKDLKRPEEMGSKKIIRGVEEMIRGIPISISEDKLFINKAYVDYAVGAGVEPVLISPGNNIDVIANACDGLILPGGADLDPTFYDENNLMSFNVSPGRDKFEREALYAFMNAGKPIFGICRGFQIIAREYLRVNPHDNMWLEYWQHVPDHSIVEELKIPRTAFSHKVSYWSSLYGGARKKKAMFVNSMHHQALIMTEGKEPDDSNIKILARTRTGMPKKETGYIVEAFKIENKKVRILAVQWHPEELKDYRLIQTFFGIEVQKKDMPKAAVLGTFSG